MSAFSLADLETLIAARAHDSASQSYTRKLLDSGAARIAKKFGEEAVEAVIAAVEGDRQALINETADVFYHSLVLLRAFGIPLQDVLSELQRRTAQSGLQEKAARPDAG